ncbi:hypothetical protein GN956_G2902, partial [Arapaima gigas]
TVNSQACRNERSQSLSTKKPLPPLPRWTSHSEPLYECPDTLENVHNVQDVPQESEVTVLRSQSLNLKKQKPLPPLPVLMSDPEPLYENPDWPNNNHNVQEQGHKGSKSAFQGLSRQPPTPPPKPLKPPRIPSYGASSALDGDPDAETITYSKDLRDTGKKLPRPPLLPPLHQTHTAPMALSDSVSDSQNIPIYLEILPDPTPITHRTSKPLPPLPRPRPRADNDVNKHCAIYKNCQDRGHKSEETDELNRWWKTVERESTSSLFQSSRMFRLKMYRIQMAVNFFTCRFNKSAETLQNYIAELNGVVDNYNKISKKVKIRTITGGTMGGLGGAAVVAGLILAPLSVGASLAVTAVGVGAIAGGGATGAVAAIVNKKRSSSDKKKVEQIVQDYRVEVLDIDRSLEFIATGVRELEKHNISRLKFGGHEADRSMLTMAELVKNNVSSIQTARRSSGIVQDFTPDGCICDEDNQKQNKDSMARFIKNLTEFTQQLQDSLDDLHKVQEIFSMALSSTLGLEDTMALLWGPSCLTVDPLGALLDKDGEEALAWGPTSPFSSSSCYADTSLASSMPIASPPSPTHNSLSGKVGADLLSLPWLSDELLDATVGADSSKEDAFTGMDWMAEKIDLSEFDLDSLMGSCDSEEPPSSPEDLIASLETHMDLDPSPHSDPFFTPFATQEISEHLPEIPSPHQVETRVKSEPPSPVQPPSLSPPPSPSFTLDLGSEVDISENEKPAVLENTPVSEVIVSLAPSVVLVLSPKEELTGASSPAIVVSSDDQSDSDSGISSVSGSPPHHSYTSPLTRSSRTKPYSIPSKSKQTPEATALAVKVKSVSSGAPRMVEKKLKKMEQNKTAATRYRQKKRAEQEALKVECAELEKRNHELAEKADSISKEIQYLKDLMEEVQKAKSRKSKVAVT